MSEIIRSLWAYKYEFPICQSQHDRSRAAMQNYLFKEPLLLLLLLKHSGIVGSMAMAVVTTSICSRHISQFTQYTFSFHFISSSEIVAALPLLYLEFCDGISHSNNNVLSRSWYCVVVCCWWVNDDLKLFQLQIVFDSIHELVRR